MPPNSRIDSGGGENRGPSREEIEILCILHAIGQHGCRADNLATLLGLSPGLASAVADGIGPLISAGWVDLHDDHLSLTDAGFQRLTHRLLELLP